MYRFRDRDRNIDREREIYINRYTNRCEEIDRY